jgi:hypothetical protein
MSRYSTNLVKKIFTIFFLASFLLLFSGKSVKAETLVYEKNSDFSTVSYADDWIFVQENAVFFEEGHTYRIDASTKTVFGGNQCTSYAPITTDCIGIGIANHVWPSNDFIWLLTDSILIPNTDWESGLVFSPIKSAYYQVNSYCYALGTENCTLDYIKIYDEEEIPTPTPTPTSELVLGIDAGGSGEGNISADTDYSGGQTYSSTADVDTNNVISPVPQNVYKTVRYGIFSYTIPNLTPNSEYAIRLHFNELYWGTPLAGGGGVGSRVFNVSANGTQVLTNYDIYQAAGGSNKAIVEQFPVTSDENGTITLEFAAVTDNALVNGVEVYSGGLPSPAPTSTPTPTPAPTPTPTPEPITETIIDTVKEMFNNLVEFFGNVIFHSDVNFLAHIKVSNDSAGRATIRSGDSGITIIFDKPYNSIPVVNVNPDIVNSIIINQIPPFAIYDLTASGFTIKLANSASFDINFNWIAMETDRAQISSTPTPTPEPTSTPTPIPTLPELIHSWNFTMQSYMQCQLMNFSFEEGSYYKVVFSQVNPNQDVYFEACDRNEYLDPGLPCIDSLPETGGGVVGIVNGWYAATFVKLLGNGWFTFWGNQQFEHLGPCVGAGSGQAIVELYRVN